MCCVSDGDNELINKSLMHYVSRQLAFTGYDIWSDIMGRSTVGEGLLSAPTPSARIVSDRVREIFNAGGIVFEDYGTTKVGLPDSPLLYFPLPREIMSVCRMIREAISVDGEMVIPETPRYAEATKP